MAQMNVEETQMVAFTLIMHSGNARALIHEAMDAMREKDFATAEQKMAEADEELVHAHQSQTDLLQEFARGTEILIQIIMVHAQDHLMTTMTLKEVAEELSHVYKMLPAAAE